MNNVNSGNTLKLILLTLVIILAAAFSPALADKAFAAGGLSGANIKDGVLVGYYGDGGDIVIPNTVTEIGEKAFEGNEDITSITIPGSVSNIGYEAFKGCTNLTSVKFSDPKDGAQMVIRVSAFNDCTSLEDITIPAVCRYVTGNVFKGCTALKEIKVDEGNPYYFTKDGVLFGPNVNEGEVEYDREDIVLIGYPAGKEAGTYKVPSTVNGRTVYKLWASSFRGCQNLTGIEIPASVTYIGGNAFEDTGLTQITIPETVTYVGSGQFEDCAKLKSVSLPSSFTELSKDFFKNCTSLQSVSMDSVTSIQMYAFQNCTSLTNIVIPDSVLSLGMKVFDGCTNLSRAYIPASVIDFPQDTDYGLGYYDVFGDCADDLLVYVISGSSAEKYAYNNAANFGWSYKVLNSKKDLSTVSDGNFSLIDAGANVKATGAFKMGTTLNIQEVTSGAQYDTFVAAAGDKKVKVYNVSLLPSGTAVPSDVELSVGIPTGILTKGAALYHLENKKAVNTNATNVSKTLKTTVSSLGYFAVIGDEDTSVVPTGPVAAESITLNKTTASVKTGKTVVLSSTILPKNTTDKTVTWSSSDESIATVSGGTVKGIAPGKATITATTANGLEASCTVTVIDGTSISAEEATLTVAKKPNSDGTIPFSFVLSDPSRIATVEVVFTTDGSDVTITGKKGFELIGEPVKGEDNTFTAVLSYLEEDQLYSGDGDVTIAEIQVSGETPKAALKSVRITGWKLDNESRFGTVKDVNTDEVIFTPLSKYDFNEDGTVDQEDLDAATKNYRVFSQDSEYETAKIYDVNEDGIIDVEDFVLIQAAMK